MITSPNSGAGNNVLTGVSCPEASACVAVGSYQSGATSRALAEELFGGSWVLTTVPNAGSGANVLAGVSCAAVGACVAVGYYDNAGVDRALAENLSASVWSVMASQDQGAGLNELNAVSCTSTSSCVAVGTYRTVAGVNQDLIETLATATWSVRHPSPDANGANNVLSGVACTSTTSCMTVGHYNSKGVAQSLAIELAHGTWTVVPSPDKGIEHQPTGRRLVCPGEHPRMCGRRLLQRPDQRICRCGATSPGHSVVGRFLGHRGGGGRASPKRGR